MQHRKHSRFQRLQDSRHLPGRKRRRHHASVHAVFQEARHGKNLHESQQAVEEKLKNISGAYISPGSGCVDKKHFVGYVELVLGCMS